MKVRAPSSIGPYVFQGTIGDGAFSVVRLVREVESGTYYACKIVPRERINTANLQFRFEQEIRINQQLHHPGIVEMYDLLSDDVNYYVIMEFCPNGELFQLIVDNKNLSEAEARPLFRQILETLDYIHSMGVSHRDIKPENLLMDRLGFVKISDFGLSRFIGANGLVATPCGSPCYASPECISGAPYDGVTTDVWSAGVILFAMLTGQLPWTKRNQAQLFRQIRRGEYSVPRDLSPLCQDFIRGLMNVDPKQRMTIPEALEHHWMKDVPPQFTSLPTPTSGVSLKMVDDFFGLNGSSEDLGSLQIPQSGSCCSFQIASIVSMIGKGGKVLPMISSSSSRRRKLKTSKGEKSKSKREETISRLTTENPNLPMAPSRRRVRPITSSSRGRVPVSQGTKSPPKSKAVVIRPMRATKK